MTKLVSVTKILLFYFFAKPGARTDIGEATTSQLG